MALTAARTVDHYPDQELRTFKVAASTTIYKGAFVGLASGYARGLVAGDTFVGLAYEGKNNASGAAGAKQVRCYTLGDFEHTLTGAAVTDIGAAVYASDDGTLTLTSTDNSFVGYMVGLPSANTIILRLAGFGTSA